MIHVMSRVQESKNKFSNPQQQSSEWELWGTWRTNLTNFLNIKYIKLIRLDQAVRREYLLVVGVDAGVVLDHAHVGDQAAGEHLHPAVVRHKRLRDSAHAHRVHSYMGWMRIC